MMLLLNLLIASQSEISDISRRVDVNVHFVPL